MKKRLPKKKDSEGVINFLPRGYTQGNIKKMTLIAPDDAPSYFPKIDPKCVPGTYFRMDGDVLNSLVTVMPDGVHVAWTSCGRCLGTPKSCVCKSGMVHSRGIEWIYIRTLLWRDGIVATHGQTFASDSHDVASRGRYWYVKKERGLGVHPLYAAGKDDTGKKPLKKRENPASGAVTGKKPLGKGKPPATPGKPSEAASAPSLPELNKDADRRSDELLEEFNKSSQKKSLRKRDERGSANTTKKKILRKRG